MARWIRNCFLPKQTVGNLGSGALGFFMREAFEVGGWSEFANDGSANWTNALNRVVDEPGGANGFAVLAANSRQVYDPLGRFTQAMADDGMVLALRAVNDQNASMWRITDYIDANNILVETRGFSPFGWVDESGIPGRVLDYGGAVLPTASWVEMDPPAGNSRARMVVTAAVGLECYVKPRAGLADTTQAPTTVVNYMYDDDDLAITLNAYFDGNNALFFKFADNDNILNVGLWGELVVPVQDTWPGFVLTSNALTTQMNNWPIYMLGASSLSIRAYTDWLSTIWTTDDLNNLDGKVSYRLLNGSPGLARLRVPNVALGDTAGNGGFVRGKLPVIRAGSTQLLGKYVPVDARGEWWHLRSDVYVPRNGPYDPMLVTSYV